jgi:hypothetical protein
LSLILRRPEEARADSGRRVTERDLGRTDPKPIVEAPRPAPVPPPVAAAPPPAPTDTTKVAVVRNNKREEYTVHRIGN